MQPDIPRNLARLDLNQRPLGCRFRWQQADDPLDQTVLLQLLLGEAYARDGARLLGAELAVNTQMPPLAAGRPACLGLDFKQGRIPVLFSARLRLDLSVGAVMLPSGGTQEQGAAGRLQLPRSWRPVCAVLPCER